MDGVLLTVKSGVSNHTAFDIPDDPCLSKFGALRRMSPHATDNFRAFVWRSLSAACRTQSAECSNVAKTQNKMSNAA